jgi:glycosyltransferase involved in cell wall biosynthesis
MLAGRPVVASDVGGLRDLVRPGVTGLTVPPGDPPALTAALDSLLDDPEARRRMGEAGRLHARRFEAAALAPRVLEVFEDALQQRVQPRSG